MIRKHKTYSRPKRPFDKPRLEEEAKIKEKYGLKNKREIWKADARIKTMREKAKKLISADVEEQKKLFAQLHQIGMNVDSISDILALQKEDYLDRRLQTVVFKKGLAETIKTARQKITHRKVLVGGSVVDIPSFVVPTDLENKISIKEKAKKVPVVEEPIAQTMEASE